MKDDSKLVPFPLAEPEPAPESDPLSDDSLMRQVQSGRIDVLALLFERHQGALLNFFLRTTGNRGWSEDLVQDVFVRILKYRQSYRPGSRFVTWMYYIARNARLDYAHKRRGEIAWDDGYAPMTLPGDEVEAQAERSLLREAMRRLSDDKREVLVLSRYQEMKYEQIAAVLGIEVGAVKVRVHRAVKELRGIYQQLSLGGTPA